MRQVPRIVVAVAALAIGLEGATRLDEWVRWGTSPTSNLESVGDLIIVDSTGAVGVPFAQYRQFSMNSRGFRGPEPTSGVPRILVLGASETFGLYESGGKEYPRQLEDSLRARGCRVSVTNAGLPGFGLPTIAATYLHRLRTQEPASLVVLYPTPPQYLDDQVPRWNPPATRRGGPPSGVHLRVARRLRDHMKVALPQFVQTFLRSREIDASRRAMAPGYMFDSLPPDRLDAFRRDLGTLLDSIQATGAKTLVATHANSFPPGAPPDSARLISWTKFYPRARLGLIPEFDRAGNQVITAEASARSMPVVDLAGVLAKTDPTKSFADFSHFTEQGSAIVASQLTSAILRTTGCPTR